MLILPVLKGFLRPLKVKPTFIFLLRHMTESCHDVITLHGSRCGDDGVPDYVAAGRGCLLPLKE